jgi:hypothetical protein
MAINASTPPTDYADYQSKLVAMVNTYGPGNVGCVLIEDEPRQIGNFNGNSSDYASMVNAAHAALSPLGVKVAAAGFRTRDCVYYAYQKILETEGSLVANDFWDRAASGTMDKVNATSDSSITQGWLNALSTAIYDYIAVRNICPGPALSDIARIWRQYSSVPVCISVELGQQDELEITTDALFADCLSSACPIVILQCIGSANNTALVEEV